MSRRSRKRQEEEALLRQQEMMRRQQMMMQQQPYGYYPQQPMNYGYMNNVPNRNLPPRFIQLTPIIQPIAMVPYATQEEPIMYHDQGYNDFGDFSGDDFI